MGRRTVRSPIGSSAAADLTATTQALGTGSGSVTTVSVVSTNGFSGTVATAGTTPAITIACSLAAGLLKSNGTGGLALAVAGTDYAVPGAIPAASTATPLADGTGAAGTSTNYAREGHVHPTDTSRAQDSLTLHLAGTETVTGAKTFNSLITAGIGIALGNVTTHFDGQIGTSTFRGLELNCATGSSYDLGILNPGRTAYYMYVPTGTTIPTFPQGITSKSTINMDAGQVVKIGGTQVLGSRRTGWTDQTATAARTDLGSTPTVAQLAAAFSALYADLKASGVIGN